MVTTRNALPGFNHVVRTRGPHYGRFARLIRDMSGMGDWECEVQGVPGLHVFGTFERIREHDAG